MSGPSRGRFADLIGNTVVFAFGSLAVKVVSLVLMPLYTTALTTAEYGVAELLNSGIEIALPILSLGIVEALYRFSIDETIPRAALFGNSLAILGCGVGVAGVMSALAGVLGGSEHAGAFFVLFASTSLFKATTQFARGLGHVKRYVAYGLVNALVLVIASGVLLLELRAGVTGYLWAYSAGYLVAALVAFIGSSEYKYVLPFSMDRALLGRMLAYSLPLVPNLLSWWIVSVSGRYMVLWGSGVAAAGLFTAASKMPALINMVTSVFQQAWQYSTAREIGSADSGAFFGKVLRGYSVASLFAAGLVMALNRPISEVLLQAEFREAWRYVPLLMLAATLGVLSVFFGTFYQALMNSRMLMVSTLVGAGTNLALCLVLVPFMGPWGAGCAVTASYVLVLAVRMRDIGRRIDMPIDHRRIWTQLALLAVMALCTSFDSGRRLDVMVWICLVLLVVSDRRVTRAALTYGWQKVNRRFGLGRD